MAEPNELCARAGKIQGLQIFAAAARQSPDPKEAIPP